VARESILRFFQSGCILDVATMKFREGVWKLLLSYLSVHAGRHKNSPVETSGDYRGGGEATSRSVTYQLNGVCCYHFVVLELYGWVIVVSRVKTRLLREYTTAKTYC
jgi:hypothetical protein